MKSLVLELKGIAGSSIEKPVKMESKLPPNSGLWWTSISMGLIFSYVRATILAEKFLNMKIGLHLKNYDPSLS